MKKSDVVRLIFKNKIPVEPRQEKGLAFAPTNIALCKYWGKRDPDLNLPMSFLQTTPQSTVTFEKILTGQGTANLYRYFYKDECITPEEVGKKMREGQADEVLKTFAWYAGLFIGTVQLTFMPEGGIWITGGVTINHLDVFDHPEFRKGIDASPAYLQQRNEYPLGILRNHELALIGSGYYAAKRLL